MSNLETGYVFMRDDGEIAVGWKWDPRLTYRGEPTEQRRQIHFSVSRKGKLHSPEIYHDRSNDAYDDEDGVVFRAYRTEPDISVIRRFSSIHVKI